MRQLLFAFSLLAFFHLHAFAAVSVQPSGGVSGGNGATNAANWTGSGSVDSKLNGAAMVDTLHATNGITTGGTSSEVASDLYIGGNVLFSTDNTGDIGAFASHRPGRIWVANLLTVGGHVDMAAVSYLHFGSYGFFQNLSDGTFGISDEAQGGTARLVFGTAVSTNASVKGSGTTVSARLGDDSDHAEFNARSIQAVRAFRTTHGTLTHAGTVTLDFNGSNTVNYLSLTGAITLAFSNLADGYTARVFIRNSQATNCTLSLPAGVQGYYTATLSNGCHMVSCESWGTVDTNVWVSTSSNGTY